MRRLNSITQIAVSLAFSSFVVCACLGPGRVTVGQSQAANNSKQRIMHFPEVQCAGSLFIGPAAAPIFPFRPDPKLVNLSHVWEFVGMAGYSEMGVSSATVLTIRVKKAQVDAFAKSELDFDEFRRHVQIFTY